MFPYYKISGIFHIIVTEKFGQIWAELTVTLHKYLSQKPRIFNVFTCNYNSEQRDEQYLERCCVLSCLANYLTGRSRTIYQQSKSQYLHDCQNRKTGFSETTLKTCRLLRSPEFTLKWYSQELFSAYNSPSKKQFISTHWIISPEDL